MMIIFFIIFDFVLVGNVVEVVVDVFLVMDVLVSFIVDIDSFVGFLKFFLNFF